MQTRRNFLKAAALAAPAWNGFTSMPGWAQGSAAATERFLFGASVYPEIDGGGQSNAILDLLEHAHMNLARVGESSWGNLELAPGQFNFGWLRDFLDQMHRRGILAILELRLIFHRNGCRPRIRRCWWCWNRAPVPPTP